MNYVLLNLFDDSDRLPEFDFSCKFIIIENLTDISLVFGPLETFRYHAQLVHRYCAINEITCSWIKHPDLVEIHSEDLEIRGGGMIKFDTKKSTLEFRGSSTAYGGYDRAILQEILENCEAVNGFEHLVGS